MRRVVVNAEEVTRARRAAAEYVVAMQMGDGAFPMGAAVGASMARRVVPYFASLGAYGLVVAAGAERASSSSRKWLEASRRWVAWYDKHRNPDGTVYDYEGQLGAWRSTGKYDSTDSYASTYLEMVAALAQAEPRPAWCLERWPFIRRSVKAILLTRQGNGLTTATPKWPLMYTMDNVEVLRGLRAAVALARTLHRPSEAREWSALGDATESGIERVLWDKQDACYLVGGQTDGARVGGLAKWYPDLMANLMAIGWLPASAEHTQLFARLEAKFADAPEMGIPAVAHTEGDLERLIWWGYASRAAREDDRFARIQKTLIAADLRKLVVTNPAVAGHVCRLLSPSGTTRL